MFDYKISIRRIDCFCAFLCYIFFTTKIFSQSPNWQWAVKSSDNCPSKSECVAVDFMGDSYVVGSFSGANITFGSVVLTNDTTTGTSDIFIVKYNSFGNVIWAKSFGGSTDDVAYSVASDSTGIYVVGYYTGSSIKFDAITVSDPTIYTGYNDMYIVKLDTDGNVLWAKGAGGMSFETAFSVATDSSGVYVVGSFSTNTAVFGTYVLTPFSTSTMTGFSDIFIVKYDIYGNVLWAKRAGGSHFDGAKDVTTDATGVYVSGYYNSTDFVFASSFLYSYGNADMCVLKYDKNGNELWVRDKGGAGGENALAISADTSGVYVVGYFTSSSINFATTVLNNTTTDGGYDIFIVKYSPSGYEYWVKKVGGYYQESVYDVLVDTSGMYLAGISSGFLFSFGSNSVVNNGGFDAFLLKFDLFGNPVWLRGFGGNMNDIPSSIAKYNSDIYVSGYFASSSLSFGSTILTNSLSPQSEMFYAKLDTTFSFVNIEEFFDGENRINIFPNPFNNQLTVRFLDEQKNCKLKLFDVLGNELKSVSISGAEFQLERDNLNSGIYFLHIIDDKKRQITKKIILN